MKFVKSNEDGNLVIINALEVAALFFNCAPANLWFTLHPDEANRYPLLFFLGGNTAVNLWFVKSCKGSLMGWALGCPMCTLMINNPIETLAEHIDTKINAIVSANTMTGQVYQTLTQGPCPI